ncbi:MAG: ParA family protein [Bacteroidota bacterium]
MHVITVCNHKGGTGKTTTSIYLGAALGLSGLRTLVIDMDPQGFLTQALGIPEPEPKASSLMLFQDQVPLTRVEPLKMKGFDLLPASMNMTKYMRKLDKSMDALWARQSLPTEDRYDVVLLDTAAAFTVYSLNALAAAHTILVPVMPEYQPVVGAEQTYRSAHMVKARLNPNLQDTLFLLTRVDGRKKDHGRYSEYIRERFGDDVLAAEIRTSSALSTKYEQGATAFDHSASSRGAFDYANAADECVRRLQLTPSSARPEEQQEASAA